MPKPPAVMDSNTFMQRVEATVRKKIREAVTANLTGGILLCVAGLVTAGLTLLFIYLFLTVATSPFFHVPGWLKTLVSITVLVLLFITQARTKDDYFTELAVTTVDGGDPLTLYVPHFGLVTNVALLSGDTAHSFVKLICAILLISPQLFAAGIEALKRVSRLQEVDVNGCAAIFAMLLGRTRKVSFQEITTAQPHLDLAQIIPQLGNIEGIVFLQNDPQGITLTPDLRNDFLAGCGLETT